VIFAGYLLWRSREQWKQTEIRPSVAGLPWIAVAIGHFDPRTFGAELFLARVSFVLLLGGLVVYFLGWKMLRAVAAPWGCAVPNDSPPCYRLQRDCLAAAVPASKLAGNTLDLLGVPALREGNVITLLRFP